MNTLPFKIKICGVTTPDDAQMVARGGADAIGLNFYPGSKRFVKLDQAVEIAAAIPAGIKKVGVFVNASLAEIAAAIQMASLDMVQLHGNEPPEFVAQVRAAHSQATVRALRWGTAGNQPIDEYLNRCATLHGAPEMLLIDSQIDGQFGGTGATADWEKIRQWQHSGSNSIPLVLAGGLTPNNIAEAIRTVKPDAVDTASGVESSPGRKDPTLVQAFIAAARRAFEAL